MFPTAGYFKGVVCPFFEHGLCHRPYCHYRHTKIPRKSQPPVPPPILKSTTLSCQKPDIESTTKPVKDDVPTYIDSLKADTCKPVIKTGTSVDVVNEKQELLRKDTESSDIVTTPTTVSASGVEEKVCTSLLDIFGETTSDEDDDNASVDHMTGDHMTSDVIDDDNHEEDLQVIQDEFIKATTKTEDGTDNTRKHLSEGDDSGRYENKGIKKKRMARSNEMSRDPNMFITSQPKQRTISDEKLKAALKDPEALYSGKKRKTRVPDSTHSNVTTGQPAPKRPKLQLVTNSKIPTKIRQRFLDAYIDEYIRMGVEPIEAYSKALEKENQLFIRSSKRMLYMNLSTHELTKLRKEVTKELEDRRKRSDDRVKSHLMNQIESEDVNKELTQEKLKLKVPKLILKKEDVDSKSKSCPYSTPLTTSTIMSHTIQDDMNEKKSKTAIVPKNSGPSSSSTSSFYSLSSVRSEDSKDVLTNECIELLNNEEEERTAREEMEELIGQREVEESTKYEEEIIDQKCRKKTKKSIIRSRVSFASALSRFDKKVMKKRSVKKVLGGRDRVGGEEERERKDHLGGQEEERGGRDRIREQEERGGGGGRDGQELRVGGDYLEELEESGEGEDEERSGDVQTSEEGYNIKCGSQSIQLKKLSIELTKTPNIPNSSTDDTHTEQVDNTTIPDTLCDTPPKERKPSMTSLEIPDSLINLTELANKAKTSTKRYILVNKKKRVIDKQPPKPRPLPSYSILKKKEIDFNAGVFYQQLNQYLLSEEDLVSNGYPRPTDQVGVASLNREESTQPIIQTVGSNAMRHHCCRCNKSFIIYNNGEYQSVEDCVYHHGRLIKSREYGEGVVSVYRCCGERRDSPGCQVASMHVTAGELSSTETGYIQSSSPPGVEGYIPQVYALDCEMCYTTIGLQLTRITIVDMNLKTVFESIVKPSHPIVDYNTRFSGLTAKDFNNINTTLINIHKQLMNIIYNDTILIGHSLESDLKAMKLIHNTVVDTAIVFPHRKGLPYKRSLKNLMAEHLHKFIQDSVDGGHDSKEDSVSCMELMIWKVKSDLQKRRRISSES